MVQFFTCSKMKVKAIIHLDMDAFYPSVEMLDNPALKGKPVIVGGSRERGVISSASYAARRFGIHSAQPVSAAMRLCPHGIFLPVRMGRYREVSRDVFRIFHGFTPLVEPLSIDEAFLDVTGSIRLFGQPEDIARTIKQTVLEETGLTVSAGVSSNKFVAKIASDMEKPDGLTVVPHDRIMEFLDPLPINKMWGVGGATQRALMRLNVRTFKDLRSLPPEVLEKRFGKHGIEMHRLSMGVDDRDVIPDHVAKSVGHEETFSRDILDIDMAKKKLLYLANKVASRMRSMGAAGRTVTLKVRYGDFHRITRSKRLSKSTDDGLEIYSAACSLLERTAADKRPVRLLGVSLSRLSFSETENQFTLFDIDQDYKKRKKLNMALDSLQKKYGERSIRPGTLLGI